MEPDLNKLKKIKKRTLKNSAVIEDMVEEILDPYTEELDKFIDKVKYMIDKKDELTDIEIEDMVLRLPVHIYYAMEGLETLGIQGDNAKGIKTESYNNVYLDAEGTIQDKSKEAELETLDEEMVEVIYSRAYKKLKTKIEKAENLFTGAKKVLNKRINELNISAWGSRYEKEIED